MQGMKRACEALLESYLTTFPCVAILGIRQCGKTTLLATLPKGWKYFDLERRADREVVARDPDAFFRLNPGKIALDEAQLAPEVFSALRVAIDERRAEKGRTFRGGLMVGVASEPARKSPPLALASERLGGSVQTGSRPHSRGMGRHLKRSSRSAEPQTATSTPGRFRYPPDQRRLSGAVAVRGHGRGKNLVLP